MLLPEAGLYHYGARAYSWRWGRFLQTDPIGTADGSDLYAYVGNDPLAAVDPSGLAAEAAGSGIGSPLTSASSQFDLDRLNTRLLAARITGDQNGYFRILAEISNLMPVGDGGSGDGGGKPKPPVFAGLGGLGAAEGVDTRPTSLRTRVEASGARVCQRV